MSKFFWRRRSPGLRGDTGRNQVVASFATFSVFLLPLNEVSWVNSSEWFRFIHSSPCCFSFSLGLDSISVLNNDNEWTDTYRLDTSRKTGRADVSKKKLANNLVSLAQTVIQPPDGEKTFYDVPKEIAKGRRKKKQGRKTDFLFFCNRPTVKELPFHFYKTSIKWQTKKFVPIVNQNVDKEKKKKTMFGGQP